MGKNNNEHNGGNNNGAGGNEKSNDDNMKKEEGKNLKDSAIVLGVYLHCQGCAKTVVKSLRGFEGVEEIEPNPKDNRVIVKGKNADPIKVAERLRKKSGKHVELISPIPKKQENKEEKKKPDQHPKVVEVVLKMYLHCEGCAKDVKHCIHKMKGVQTVDPDMTKSQVTVKGSMEPEKLVNYVKKELKKHVEIVKSSNKNGEKKEGDHQKKENEPKEWKIELPYPKYPPGLVYASQLFSEENPNACCLM